AALARLATIDLRGLDPRLRQCRFEIACDVDNPLLGPHGASAVFGPQKGAAAPMVRQLDAALTTWADVLEAATGRAVRDLPGAGAAGGLGAGFAALVDVSMHRGVDVVASAARLADRVASVDWVFTGEGCVDGQTSHGKVPWGVARIARAAGVGVIVFGGQVTPDATALLDQGVRAIVPIGRAPATLAEALAAGPADLAAAVEMVTRLLLAR
ncbi:MAG: glycerate kinase, partial [Micrococcales bacterium]|nr:glycerate kinase [Micrococcales bacterium]